ncbi:MAG TPA: hypothetical protein VFK52_08115 [Nocardioidaceae bacterium]|nr:hypothetical protein [Nocardioidaceae bacterium]
MPTAPLKPLATVAWAQLLVFFDFRIDGLDLIPDPLGWVVSAVALGTLATLHVGFQVAGVACWVAALPSVVDMIDGGQPLVTTIVTIATLVFVFATCTAIMPVVPERAASANALRWTDLALTFALIPLVFAARTAGDFAALAVIGVIAALAVFVWFLVLLFQTAKLTPGRAPEAAR